MLAMEKYCQAQTQLQPQLDWASLIISYLKGVEKKPCFFEIKNLGIIFLKEEQRYPLL